MSDNGESMLGKLIFWAVVIIAAVVILKVVFAVLGIAFVLALRLLPLLIVAFLLYKAWQWLANKQTTPGE